ncbi:MAG: ribonucleoside-triphosphate reductase, partial [Bacteroidales bacterium]|nr:ribonucleoside-triphosphate reductase [Bacteroidales bacterium]
MDVRKTNGTYEEFDNEKLKRGIRQAYMATGQQCPEEVVVSITDNLYIYDKISSQEIRRQVVESLMSINKKAALEYIERFDSGLDLRKKRDFIKDYINASNAATGSKFDANANITRKNIVTLGQELYKENNIKQNRYIMRDKIKSLYGRELADRYVADLESHVLYKHDESGTPGYPYCVAITMYPFLESGLKELGGVSVAPTDLKSFCGEFINLVYSVSSQFMGAVATPEFLMYFDYFLRKDYGDDYLSKLDTVVENNLKQRTLVKVIDNYFQQVVHSMNMPAGNRGYQTVFWNIGYFDKPYFEGVFGDFRFPDGTAPIWDTLSWLQKHFMNWFNEERNHYVLTFPVETMALLTDGGDDYADKEYADFTARMWSKGHSFFCYISNSP